MSGRNSTATVAVVSACAAVAISEIIRRLISWARCRGEVRTDESYRSYGGGESLPEFGERLREEEYSFPANVHAMNNGSYGGVPQRVLKAQQRLMDERERIPEQWYRFEARDRYKHCAKVVAEFAGAKPENLVLVENVTAATNSILKSYQFQPGDQVLVTSHTYGAVLRTLENVNNLIGVGIVKIDIPVQTSVKEIMELYTKALDENPAVKMALVDHIASFSAVVMPLRDLIRLCHARGVIIAVDGAHAPGQLPLRLEELGADFYFGNLHKWLFSPRGCALFYIHPKHHSWIRSAVSSHNTFDPDIRDRFHYVGTRDNTPYYVARHAISFFNHLGGLDRITAYNTEMAYWAAEMLAEAWNTSYIKLDPELRAPFMCLVVLPETPQMLKYDELPNRDRLNEIAYEISRRGVYVAITSDGKQTFLRISAQVYNYREEYCIMRDVIGKVLGIKIKS